MPSDQPYQRSNRNEPYGNANTQHGLMPLMKVLSAARAKRELKSLDDYTALDMARRSPVCNYCARQRHRDGKLTILHTHTTHDINSGYSS